MPSFEASRAGYAALWEKATVLSTRQAEVGTMARRILSNRAAYEAVAAATGVPWFFVGCLHIRESGGDFKTHLHNGDSLRDYTQHVPAGRPKVGHGPPFTWTESAVDALKLEGFDRIAAWPIERMLYAAEAYNGWGYAARGVNSPYLWGATSLQQPGKYVADHVWSDTATDSQMGVAAILKLLVVFDASIAARVDGVARIPTADAPPKAPGGAGAGPPKPASQADPAPAPKPAAPASSIQPARSGLWAAILNLFIRRP